MPTFPHPTPHPENFRGAFAIPNIKSVKGKSPRTELKVQPSWPLHRSPFPIWNYVAALNHSNVLYLTILEGSLGGNYHLQFMDEAWEPYRASYGEPCILTSWNLSSKQLSWQDLNPCANHWESPGKPLHRHSRIGVGQLHSQSSQEWEITVTSLIWPELPVDKVENSARHSNFLGLCSDNCSPSFPLRKTPIMKCSSLPFCCLLSVLCSLPKPPSWSDCSLCLRLDSRHLSPFTAGQRNHLTHDRLWGKPLYPQISHFKELMFPKGRVVLCVYWLVKSLVTWWELFDCNVSLCTRSDKSGQQLC